MKENASPAIHQASCTLPPTGNVTLLLNEIGHALDRLLETGDGTTIDLGSIPMTPQEMLEFDTALGVGEVMATLEADGHNDIIETSYPGVWRITLRSAGGAVLARHVEVTRVPGILLSHDTDMIAGRRRLARDIDELRLDESNSRDAGVEMEGETP